MYFGSHHWQAVGADGARWFVSADDLRAGAGGGRSPRSASTWRSSGERTRRLKDTRTAWGELREYLS